MPIEVKSLWSFESCCAGLTSCGTNVKGKLCSTINYESTASVNAFWSSKLIIFFTRLFFYLDLHVSYEHLEQNQMSRLHTVSGGLVWKLDNSLMFVYLSFIMGPVLWMAFQGFFSPLLLSDKELLQMLLRTLPGNLLFSCSLIVVKLVVRIPFL